MTSLEQVHHEHARLADQLSDLSETVRVIRDDGVYDPERFREVFRFIEDVALPHLRHEEEHVFPLAAALGLPAEALEFLRRDHEELRVLAKRAIASGLEGNSSVLPLDAAAVIDRFVLAFDEHARREESLFRELTRVHN
jgi:hemerythrin-like domain-containing protein